MKMDTIFVSRATNLTIIKISRMVTSFPENTLAQDLTLKIASHNAPSAIFFATENNLFSVRN
jgi:hypothetical protein